jgi:hypothetical protein
VVNKVRQPCWFPHLDSGISEGEAPGGWDMGPVCSEFLWQLKNSHSVLTEMLQSPQERRFYSLKAQPSWKVLRAQWRGWALSNFLFLFQFSFPAGHTIRKQRQPQDTSLR